MVETLVDLASRMGHWGYLLVFLVIALECQVGLGFFMPAESLVLMSGFLAGQRVFDLEALIVTVAVAAIAGDSLGYELGRHLGRGWLERHGHRVGITASRLDRADELVRRHGGKGVFVSHFSHLLRPMMPFVAGSRRMSYPRFFLFNAAGCVAWAASLVLLGYFFGDEWDVLEKWIGRAGLVLGGVILLVVSLVWLWGWMARHEIELRELWDAFLRRPRIAALRRRFAVQIDFLQDRLTPGGYLGLHLTVGIVAIVLASWWFGGIAEDLLNRDPTVALDYRIAIWFHQHATAGLTRVVEVVTFFGSGWFLASASGAAALLLAWRRSWYRLLALVLTMAGGGLLDLLLKLLFHRARPAFAHPIVVVHGFSFPSGHTMGATLFYGFAALALAQAVSTWRWRVLPLFAGCLVVVLVGFSRVYLGAHFASDVLGGIAAGIAWLAFCVTAAGILERRHCRRGRGPRGAA